MQVKTCPAVLKAAGPADGTEEGVFEAIVAAYNVDSVGDRIMPGAFKNTIAAWKASESPIPVVWSHRSDDPEYHIGYVEDAEERDEGLWVKGRLDMDEAKPAKIYRLLKGRRVKNFSFAYDEVDVRPATTSDGAKKELLELKVYEVGPCLIGANQATSVLAVKSQPLAKLAAGPGPLRKGHGMTARDLRTALDVAVTHQHGGRARYVWVRDYTDDWVVFSAYTESELTSHDGLYQQSYSVNDGTATLLDEPFEVVERIVYAPKNASPASTAPASPDASVPPAEKNITDDAAPATPAPPAAASASATAPTAAPEAKATPARPGTASERLRTALDLLQVEADSHSI